MHDDGNPAMGTGSSLNMNANYPSLLDDRLGNDPNQNQGPDFQIHPRNRSNRGRGGYDANVPQHLSRKAREYQEAFSLFGAQNSATNWENDPHQYPQNTSRSWSQDRQQSDNTWWESPKEPTQEWPQSGGPHNLPFEGSKKSFMGQNAESIPFFENRPQVSLPRKEPEISYDLERETPLFGPEFFTKGDSIRRSSSRNSNSEIVRFNSLADHFNNFAMTQNRNPVSGGDMLLAWRLIGHNEQTLKDVLKKQEVKTKNQLKMALIKELHQDSANVPDSIDVSEVLDETCIYFWQRIDEITPIEIIDLESPATSSKNIKRSKSPFRKTTNYNEGRNNPTSWSNDSYTPPSQSQQHLSQANADQFINQTIRGFSNVSRIAPPRRPMEESFQSQNDFPSQRQQPPPNTTIRHQRSPMDTMSRNDQLAIDPQSQRLQRPMEVNARDNFLSLASSRPETSRKTEVEDNQPKPIAPTPRVSISLKTFETFASYKMSQLPSLATVNVPQKVECMRTFLTFCKLDLGFLQEYAMTHGHGSLFNRILDKLRQFEFANNSELSLGFISELLADFILKSL